MGLNTYPYNPFPASTDKLDEAHNEQIQAEIDQVKNDVTNLNNEIYGDSVTYPYADVITIEDAVPSNLVDCTVKIEPVQSGSGDPSPENVRPITGHTEASVQRDGRNLFDKTSAYMGNDYVDESGTEVHSNGWGYARIYNVKGGNTYTLSGLTGNNPAVCWYDKNDTFIGGSKYANATTKTITLPQNVDYLKLSVNDSNLNSLQVEIGESATPYVPYAGKTYTIALGDTIYGGTVDFDSGVMTVTMAQIASYDGETIGEPWISDRDVYAAGTTPTTGAQVVYTIATPTTIQLTPQRIQLLKGTNTITASTGNISVTVNGVSGAIGSLQTQANATDEALEELKADIADKLPTAPTTDGAYVLTVTVASGTPTYSWESAE